MKQEKMLLSLGPWGGTGGSYWSFNRDSLSTIKQIMICHGVSIDSITFKHEHGGKTECSKFGGSGGKEEKITLQSNEYLTSISGYHGGNANALKLVNSLKLVTNLKEYGPYGAQEGIYFTMPMQDAQIVGFYGRSGNMLDAIGVYIAPAKPLYVPVGPWGGPEGDKKWSVNESGEGIIKQIVISQGSNTESFSLKFKFEVNGQVQYSKDYGASGSTTHEINLDAPQEYLTRITGYVGYTGDRTCIIISLKFFTNVGEYGPYGDEEGGYFTSPIGKIVGLFGRSGTLLDAVGVYMEQAQM